MRHIGYVFKTGLLGRPFYCHNCAWTAATKRSKPAKGGGLFGPKSGFVIIDNDGVTRLVRMRQRNGEVRVEDPAINEATFKPSLEIRATLTGVRLEVANPQRVPAEVECSSCKELLREVPDFSSSQERT